MKVETDNNASITSWDTVSINRLTDTTEYWLKPCQIPYDNKNVSLEDFDMYHSLSCQICFYTRNVSLKPS